MYVAKWFKLTVESQHENYLSGRKFSQQKKKTKIYLNAFPLFYRLTFLKITSQVISGYCWIFKMNRFLYRLIKVCFKNRYKSAHAYPFKKNFIVFNFFKMHPGLNGNSKTFSLWQVSVRALLIYSLVFRKLS